MSYEKELAFHLRQRGTREDDLATILAEVRAVAPDDKTATAEFGAAADYATKFPQRTPARSRGRIIVAIATVLATTYSVVNFIIFPYFGITLFDSIGPIRLWPALLLIAIGVVVGFLVDRNRPLPPAPFKSS